MKTTTLFAMTMVLFVAPLSSFAADTPNGNHQLAGNFISVSNPRNTPDDLEVMKKFQQHMTRMRALYDEMQKEKDVFKRRALNHEHALEMQEGIKLMQHMKGKPHMKDKQKESSKNKAGNESQDHDQRLGNLENRLQMMEQMLERVIEQHTLMLQPS